MKKFLEFLELLPSSNDIAERAKLLAYLENAQVLGMAFFDDLMVCQWATAAFGELMGRELVDIVGASLQSLFPRIEVGQLKNGEQRQTLTGYASVPSAKGGAPSAAKKELVTAATPLWQDDRFFGTVVLLQAAPGAEVAPRAFSISEEPLAQVLRQLEEDARTTKLLERLEASFLLLDDGGKADYISPRARELFKLEGEADSPSYDISKDSNFSRPETASLVQDALMGQEAYFPPVDYYTELEGALGRGADMHTTLAFSLLPMEDAGRRTILCLLISQPVLAERLSHSVTLMQRSESVAMLARGVAHEFNNIFAAIKGVTSLLQSEADSESSEASYLQKVNGLVDRGVKLIGNLTSYARLHEPRVSKLAVESFFENFTSLVEFVVPKDVTLELSMKAVGFVDADPNSLRQALFNIVQNSFEAMLDSEDKRIRIEVTEVAHRDLPHGFVRFSAPSILLVRIIDSGPGIPSDLTSSIFEPYFSTKDPQSSSGLGLNVTQQIVRRLGGVVMAERTSELGGAAFNVYLPLHKGH